MPIAQFENTFDALKRKKSFLPKLIQDKWKPYILNRYFLTVVGFAVWMTFFDRNDFLLEHTYRNKLNALRKECAYYDKEIKKNKTTITELFTNSKNLERYARERYFMKRDNEDIFVFVDRNNKMLWPEKPE
jgi:cell division protein FtsB